MPYNSCAGETMPRFRSAAAGATGPTVTEHGGERGYATFHEAPNRGG